MKHVVHCDGEMRVVFEKREDFVDLTIGCEEDITFTLRLGHVAAILDGETIQLSGGGGHCRLSRQAESIRMACGFRGKHCICLASVAEFECLLIPSLDCALAPEP